MKRMFSYLDIDKSTIICNMLFFQLNRLLMHHSDNKKKFLHTIYKVLHLYFFWLMSCIAKLLLLEIVACLYHNVHQLPSLEVDLLRIPF